jgi:magnesium transporter
MARKHRQKKHKLGKAPGSFIYTGDQVTDSVTVQLIDFNETDITVVDNPDMDVLKAAGESEMVSWINIAGLHDVDYIAAVGQIYNLHPLLIEDILNIHHRPGYYDDGAIIAMVLKMLTPDKDDPVSNVEQIAEICGPKFVLSFKETTKIRSRKSDYLAFALIDAIVDHYLVAIEEFGEKVEELEEALMEGKADRILEVLYKYKRDINFLRKVVRPVREIAVQFEKTDVGWLEDATVPFLKDLVDHAEYSAEAIETFRETLNDLLNFYHTQSANKLNDILKVLTIFSVIFIPLSFLAGLYGTNFEFMPELHYTWSWPVFIVVEIVIALGMLYFFRRKGWL